ncbi:MAG: ABC transporter ATP-binding protein/permease [Bacteroidales bacterium]|nr:ABC transporter ATP-binding protein/permease [Bacteroidales bacterium]
MLSYIQKRFALSQKGAKDFRKGVISTLLLDIAIMLPAVFLYIFLDDYLNPIINSDISETKSLLYYLIIGISFIVIMYLIAFNQYRSTYSSVYEESEIRRISLAEKLRKLPLAFFGEKNLSDLTTTIMDDSTQLEHTFSHAIPQLIASLLSVSLISLGLLFYNWQLSLALFWVIPVATLIVISSKKMLKKTNSRHYANQRLVSEHIQEGLETIQEIKSYNQEEAYSKEFDQKLDIYEKELTKGELLAAVMLNISQGVLKLGIASVIIVGAKLMSTGSIDLFMYLIFLIFASRIFDPINEVFNHLIMLSFLDVRINRMREMEAMPIQEGSKEFAPANYDIEFKNVNFAYETGQQVINNVSFVAKQGEITALVGPSGGGKSTTAKLAARFWDVNSGKISVGGKNIKNIDPETLLKHYSVVFQDVVLFNTSIIDNIRIGKRNASDEEIIRIAKLAQCHEFISKIPNGYDTIIGENGETLSGGERQRISIARALLKDAPIVLLDEATASLDVENETKIQAGISELIKNKTVLIIAHRMRTVANADKIVVLENGTLKEEGNPDYLKKQKGVFAQMVKHQLQEV